MVLENIIRGIRDKFWESIAYTESFNQNHDNNQLLENDTISASFFQDSPVHLVEQAIVTPQTDWITYVLLALLVGMAILFFTMPERLNSITVNALIRKQMRSGDRNVAGSGAAIQSFFFINYLVTTSFFVYFMLMWMNFFQGHLLPGFTVLLYIAGITFILFIYRAAMIWFLGYLFDTRSPAELQLRLFISTDLIIGVLLIPVILLSLYTENDIPIFLGIIIIFMMHIFRWFQSFLLGKSILGVSLIHLIVYLCTLEIAPLIVVVKLMQTF